MINKICVICAICVRLKLSAISVNRYDLVRFLLKKNKLYAVVLYVCVYFFIFA